MLEIRLLCPTKFLFLFILSGQKTSLPKVFSWLRFLSKRHVYFRSWVKSKHSMVGFIYTFWYSLPVYQFNSRIGVLIHSSFANDYFRRISTTFQHHFKICFCVFYMKKKVAFTLISFAVLKWDDCLSVQLPFELPVQIMVQLLLELEPNWLVQNVIELEFELSRM